jgi:nucleoid-associated protein YgaU
LEGIASVVRNIVIIVASGLVIVAAILGFQFLNGRDEATETVAVPPPAAAPAEEPKALPPPEDTQPQVIAPSFDVVRVSREGTGVIAGRAQPDSEVTVLANDKVIGRVTANRNGEWVLIFQEPLDTGTVEISLKARKGSAAPIDSNDIVVVSIPERQEQGQPGEEGVVAVLTPRDGKGASRVLQEPTQSSSPLADLLTVDTMDFDLDGMAIMTGRSKPNSEIRLYLDGEFQEAVTADAQGRWSYSPQAPVSAGEHKLRLDQVLEGDNVRLRIEQPFDRETELDTRLAEGEVEIQPGNNLWTIARRLYGAGVMYTLIFQENKGRIVDPDLIYPNQLFKLPRPGETPPEDAARTN